MVGIGRLAVYHNIALAGLIKLEEELHDGGFSGATGPDEGNAFTGADVEVDIFKHFNIRPGGIGEADISEFDMAFEAEGGLGYGLGEAHLGGFVEDFGDTFGGPNSGDDFGVEASQAGDGAADDGGVHGKVEEATFGEYPFLDEQRGLPDDKEQGAKHDKDDESGEEAAHMSYA